jgi:hypothetical protein
MSWLHPATLGDVSIAILAAAGLLLGAWLMARGPRAAARDAAAPSDAQPSGSPAGGGSTDDPAVPAEAPARPTTFRHGTIRVAVGPAPGPPQPQPGLQPEPAAPEPAPTPFPPAPRTSFRQGRIRLGGIERGAPPHAPDDDEPPRAA